MNSHTVNSVIFKLEDGLGMVMLDEDYTLATEVIEFSTTDSLCDELADSQLILANLDEDGGGSRELARYTIFGPDNEPSSLKEVVEELNFESIVLTLVNDYNQVNRMKMH